MWHMRIRHVASVVFSCLFTLCMRIVHTMSAMFPQLLPLLLSTDGGGPGKCIIWQGVEQILTIKVLMSQGLSTSWL